MNWYSMLDECSFLAIKGKAVSLQQLGKWFQRRARENINVFGCSYVTMEDDRDTTDHRAGKISLFKPLDSPLDGLTSLGNQ